MADTYFEPPWASGGSAEEQLRSLYSYLRQMSMKLNEAMNAVTLEQMDDTVRQMITVGGESAEVTAKESNALKSMIVKTAQVVRHEMDVIQTRLEDHYQALSDDFGEYERNLDSRIEATANGILQEYNYEERITSTQEGLDDYKRSTSQYIFTGLVDEQNMKYGIAIGYNVTDAEGHLQDENKMATFTMDELSFFVNGVKAAWFSNSTFFIDRGQIETSLQMGNNFIWRIMSDYLVLMNM